MTGTQPNPNALRSAARRYAKAHGVKYTEALRHVAALPPPSRETVHINVINIISDTEESTTRYLVDPQSGAIGDQYFWRGERVRLVGLTDARQVPPGPTNLIESFEDWAADGFPSIEPGLNLLFAGDDGHLSLHFPDLTTVDIINRPVIGLPGSAAAADTRSGIVLIQISADDSRYMVGEKWFLTEQSRNEWMENSLPQPQDESPERGARHYAGLLDSDGDIQTLRPITRAALQEHSDTSVATLKPYWRSVPENHKDSIAKGGALSGVIPTWLTRTFDASRRTKTPRRLPETRSRDSARVYLVDMFWRDPYLCGLIVLTPGCSIEEAVTAAREALPPGSGKDGTQWRLDVPHPKARLRAESSNGLANHPYNNDPQHRGCEQCVPLARTYAEELEHEIGFSPTVFNRYGDVDRFVDLHAPLPDWFVEVDAEELGDTWPTFDEHGYPCSAFLNDKSDIFGLPFGRQLLWQPSGFWDAPGFLRPTQTVSLLQAESLDSKWRVGKHSHAIRISGSSPYKHYW